MGILDDVVSNTAGGASIISEQNDPRQINWRNARGDVLEMSKAGGDVVAGAIARANINVSNGKVSVFVAFKPAWHEIGKVIDKAANAKEATELANMGYLVAKEPDFLDLSAYGGDPKHLTGGFSVVRTDTGDVLTRGKTVGEGYELFQNHELFSMMDNIISEGAMYETAGVLGLGERVWMLAQMPESRFEPVPGDEVHAYLLATAAHDGTGAIRFMGTSERIVCANTLRAAMNGRGTKSISFRHTTNVAQRAKEAQTALGLAHKGFAKMKEQVDMAVRTKIEPAEYFSACLDDIVDVTAAEQQVTRASIKDGSILQAILDIKETEDQATEAKRYERALKKRREVFDDIMERYESDRNNGMEAISGTGWAAFNAVTESIDHGRGSPNFKGDDRKRAESRFDSVISGRADEIKQNALELVLEQAV